MSNPMKDVREAHKLTQEEMAKKLACSVSTIYRCEASGRLPIPAVANNLRRMARQKGIEIEASSANAEGKI